MGCTKIGQDGLLLARELTLALKECKSCVRCEPGEQTGDSAALPRLASVMRFECQSRKGLADRQIGNFSPSFKMLAAAIGGPPA